MVYQGCIYQSASLKSLTETWINLMDVEKVVAYMDKARTVLPVPEVKDWGRRSALRLTYITTEKDPSFYSVEDLIQAIGHQIYDVMKPQILAAQEILRSVGLYRYKFAPEDI
jgi:hypothetical protein